MILEKLKQLFWAIRYTIYSRDLYKALREGRGTKDNPLVVDDLKPLQEALRRLEGR